MNKETRSAIERMTQRIRGLLEGDFTSQLEGVYDILPSGSIAPLPGPHLSSRQRFSRSKILASIEHKQAGGMAPAESVADYIRDAAFTTLNRFVALKMLESRELVQECITRGEQSIGFREFCGLAPGIALLPGAEGYRLYLESIFEELSTEVKVLFDRRDSPSVLWPRHATFEEILSLLNAPDVVSIWNEDETIGWVYQYFNLGDERRAMREESPAPRNGRELAIRNQFFTPRYVVQFLADNTLGRIWYEMQQGKTRLSEKCEYLVREDQENYPPRAQKDPRDLRIIDPACGSGHFLLYVFDLLLVIYEESWANPNAPKSEVSGMSLRQDYADLNDLKRAMPGLILRHNLHGVDIDPRCAQIAQFALWMRGQRAFRDLGIARSERPLIRRANIVVAEPMAGDETTLQEFSRRLGDEALSGVFKALFKTLGHAGELGLLLRVEALVLRRANRGETGELFTPPEERIRDALARFSAEAEMKVRTKRRLFAEDALHGVGLLQIAEQKFDVVLMNPPFGAPIPASEDVVGKISDLFAAFITRARELLVDGGRLGAITPRSALFLPKLESWRRTELIQQGRLKVLADLGFGVLDALVETCAYVTEVTPSRSPVIALRVLQDRPDDKGDTLNRLCRNLVDGIQNRQAFICELEQFERVPGLRFAYFSPGRITDRFTSSLLGSGVSSRVGLNSGDDFRFLRLWWEVSPESPETPPENGEWVWFAKGGEYSPYAGDIHLKVRWADKGRSMQALNEARGTQSSNIWMLRDAIRTAFFRRGVTWPRRTTSGYSPQALPEGCMFAHKGGGALAPPEIGNAGLLAYLMAAPVRYCFELLVASADEVSSGSAARSYESGDFLSLPACDKCDWPRLSTIGTELARLGRLLLSLSETSAQFSPFAFLDDPESTSLEDAFRRFENMRYGSLLKMLELSFEVDEAVQAAWALPLDELGAIEDVLGPHPMRYTNEAWDNSKFDTALALNDDALVDWTVSQRGARRFLTKKAYYVDRRVELLSHAFEVSPTRIIEALRARELDPVSFREYAERLLSVAVGMAFGRWSGGSPPPLDQDPFARMPDGRWALSSTAHGILVDDVGHSSEITTAVRAALGILLPKAGDIDSRLMSAVGSPSLRDWLITNYFEIHVKQYSKSRRKAPVYWQLATPSESYSVWLYIHALTKDSIHQVVNDYAAPKLSYEERKLEAMRAEIGVSPTAIERKRFQTQEEFVSELRVFLEDIKRIAPLWNPNLNDGVIVNFAPLWRLVPQNKALQKELKAEWDALSKGDYDWSNLAMQLWPERVVPKCATDRSLAIAHGLEENFWSTDAAGKCAKRPIPVRSVADIVRERTSPAIKAALQSLIDAPHTNVGFKRSSRNTGRPRRKGGN